MAPGRRRASTAVALVPARTLADAAKTLSAGGAVTVALAAVGVGEGMIGFAGGGRRTTTRLLDAEFPKFRQLFPTEHTAAATRRGRRADRGDQARRPGRRPRSPRCGWSSPTTGCVVDAGGDDDGSAEEELDGEFDGEPLTIAFNPGYLLDGLGVLHSAAVLTRFTTPDRPAVIAPGRDRPSPPRRPSAEAASDADRSGCRSAPIRVSVPADAESACPADRRSAARARSTDLGREDVMQLGLVGLGKMGGNMRERLRDAGHEVVGYDRDPEVTRRRRRCRSWPRRCRRPGWSG